MCGRYYVNDEMFREVEKLVSQVNKKSWHKSVGAAGRLSGRDIHPSDMVSVLFIAGFYGRYEDGDRFMLLTTATNASMKPVYDRMPLLLKRDEVASGDCMDNARKH